MHLPRTVLSLSRERTGFHAFPNFNYPPIRRCIGAFIRSARPKPDGARKNFDYGGATVGANRFLIL